MQKSLIILGSGGHASVLLEIIRECQFPIKGYVDFNENPLMKEYYLGADSFLERASFQDEVLLVNGLGSIHKPYKRKEIFEKYKNLGYQFQTLVHPKAILSQEKKLGEGVQIMAGVVLQTGCVIGENSIINTGAHIDHHSTIGQHTHIAPSVTLCGNVTVGHVTHIGPNSTLIQGVVVGDEKFIPAASLIKE
ncbi:MAG: acetyltransferase [Alphaproteobacteria bacterium]|nr:acetyltransferase [Candidatus Parcubacteria bacterium]NCQ67526.1 acetyltransferase [Alphaproteobacteria bacterium]